MLQKCNDLVSRYPMTNVGYNKDDVPFTPDFGTLGKLQEQFGNDIDLMINKPQYRDLINANLQPVESVGDFENIDVDLTDEQKLDLLPSREFDVNETREYLIAQSKDFKNSASDKSA